MEEDCAVFSVSDDSGEWEQHSVWMTKENALSKVGTNFCGGKYAVVLQKISEIWK